MLFRCCFLVWPNTFAILCNRLSPSGERFRYASYNLTKQIMATKKKTGPVKRSILEEDIR